MSTQLSTPTLAKIALGALITRVREASGKDRTAVAAELGVDKETYRRWELGKIAPKPIALKAIGPAIGATPEEMSRMTSLSLDSKKRGIFEGSNVPPELRVLYESEATALEIRSLDLEYIPGLLQTPRYHQLAQEAQLPVPTEFAANIRNLRTRRQQVVFARDPLPKMRFVIGPAALRYLDNHPEMRDEQLARLRDVARRPGVDIRVLTGFHAGMLGPFTIVKPRADTGARSFVYVESIDGGRYLEGDVVSQYAAVLDAVGDGQSTELEEYLR